MARVPASGLGLLAAVLPDRYLELRTQRIAYETGRGSFSTAARNPRENG